MSQQPNKQTNKNNFRKYNNNKKIAYRKVSAPSTSDPSSSLQLLESSTNTNVIHHEQETKTNVHSSSQHVGGLKCCTYNIHVFKTANKQNNLERFIEYITRGQDGDQPFDIIGLNEAFESKMRKGQVLTPLPEIEKNLSKYYNTEYKCYYAATCRTMGNCIFTKLPVKKTQLWKLSKGPGGVRNVLGMQIDLEKVKSPVEYVFLTHLDFINEEWRVHQFSEILTFMEKFMKSSVSEMDKKFIVMGDFNAMYMKDYTPEFWDQLQLHRMEEKWEPPVSTLMDILLGDKKDDKLSIKRHLKCDKLYDTWRLCNETIQFNGQNLSSSRLKTRIDYILCSKSLRKNVLSSYIDTKTKTTHISDHNPVITHFALEE